MQNKNQGETRSQSQTSPGGWSQRNPEWVETLWPVSTGSEGEPRKPKQEKWPMKRGDKEEVYPQPMGKVEIRKATERKGADKNLGRTRRKNPMWGARNGETSYARRARGIRNPKIQKKL